MTCLRPLAISLISLTLILQLSFATQTIAAPLPADAQSAQQSERERLRRIMHSATTLGRSARN